MDNNLLLVDIIIIISNMTCLSNVRKQWQFVEFVNNKYIFIPTSNLRA